MSGFRILEHTADVGVEATGATLAETFIQATRGLLDISGASGGDAATETIEIRQEADDIEALLVYWLEEVLYAQDARDAVICSIDIETIVIDPTGNNVIVGRVGIRPRTEEEAIEGTAVKAITYHQLKVERSGDGWLARVYVDI